MRKGLSAVYGFVVVYLLIMAGLSAISNVASTQASLNQSVDQARQLDSIRSSEHLSVQYFNGSAVITNDGSTISTLEYLVYRSNSGTTFSKLDQKLPVDANATIQVPPADKLVGVLTDSGNLFVPEQQYIPGDSSCTNGTSILTAKVSPAGSGTTSPLGVTLVCDGQVVPLTATASPGYSFSRWSGAGSGSYSGTENPTSLTPEGLVGETAEFVPALDILSISPSVDGVASGGPARSAVVMVVGPTQEANITVGSTPPGVSVSFNPPTFEVSPAGASVTMTVSFNGSDYGLYHLPVLVTGADGQKANSTYGLQTTPPNGDVVATSFELSLNGIGNPREHKSAYWKGDYFFAFSEATGRSSSTSYLPVYYSDGWVTGVEGGMGPDPFYGYDFDFSQSSNLILKAAVSDGGAELCYNVGVIGGSSVDWQYNGVGCEGPQTPTRYTVVGYASGLIDSAGNWWAAVETEDSQHDLHFEVLTASNGAWTDVYVSPSFGSTTEPVPQLLQLADGMVVVVYTTFTASSGCYGGDSFITTGDGGYSWSPPNGPYTIGGAPLCYDRSSAAAVGDTIYVGGVDGAGDLADWSYDLGLGSFQSATLLHGVAYAAMGSVGNVLLLAYTTASTCSGQDSLHLMWSYDGGSRWEDSGTIGCVHDYVILSTSVQSYQVAIVSDILASGDLSPEFALYTV